MTTIPLEFEVEDENVDINEPGYVHREPGVAEQFDDVGTTVPPPNQDYVFVDEGDNVTFDKLEITPSEKLLTDYLRSEGFGDHHIQVYDHWIFRTAAINVSSRFLKFKDGRVACFENLRIFPPRYTRNGKVLELTPKLAREEGITYGSDWHVDIVMRQGDCSGPELDRRNSVCIGTIPTMLKSRRCILHGKSPRELALFGEDPDDPGGYFVVAGVEKVVMLQEQLSVNKIFLMQMDTKGSVVARMTANTTRGTALIELALDKETNSIIQMRFPSMRVRQEAGQTPSKEKYKSINVLRIFRILGVREPEEIENLLSLFMKPDHVKKSMLKLTRNLVDFLMFTDDVDIMVSLMEKTGLTEEEKNMEVRRVLDADLFPHLNDFQGPDGETPEERATRISTAKVYLLAIMVARFLEYKAGYRSLDDRDSWSNKRVEGAGRMMEQLFRNGWRKLLGTVQASIDSDGVKDLGGVIEKIPYSTITKTFHDSFITSKWGVKGTQMKDNVARTLERDSVVSTFAHINTVDVGISRTDRQAQIRLVQNSQYGFICPVSTPEGENAGLLKNLGITAKVSLERRDSEINRVLIGDPEKNIEQRVFFDINAHQNYPDKAMVNGKFLGWCYGQETKDFLIALRRQDALPLDMSVILEDDWLYVDIGPSRLVRPLLILDPDQGAIIDRLGLRGAPNDILLGSGAMEYVSSWEQEYIKVAPSFDDIRRRLESIEEANRTYRAAQNIYDRVQRGEEIIVVVDQEQVVLTLQEAETRVQSAQDEVEKLRNNRPYTHVELDSQAILGVAASLIPWPNHNQAPRNTYQVSMGKQALGVYHANHSNRFDGKMKILDFPDRPMVETCMYDVIGLDDRGPGENNNVMFATFPYTEEDAFVFKGEFLDNGGHRMHKFLTYKNVVSQADGIVERLAKPDIKQNEDPGRYEYIQHGGPDDPMNGLPFLGAPLKQGNCVIGKIQHIPANKEIRNESTFLRVGDEGIVDKVLVSSDRKTTVVTVKLRIMRVPIPGDKFAPRNAQKGTMGLRMSDIDLPMNEDGIGPDIVVNAHSMPTRMTMSYPMEMQASKHGAYRGVHVNGGPFKPFNLDQYRQTMKDYGHNEFGYEYMRSGTSGRELQAPMNMGPVFFQSLKHHVKDKVQARSQGAVKPMTRQPPKGRGNRGGLRFGEMERDAGIAHGASSFLRERLMYVSDGYQAVFCKRCGDFAINDAQTRVYKCRLCGTDDTFGRTVVPYAYKLLVHLLAPFGINLRPDFVTSEEYAASIFGAPHTTEAGDVDDVLEQLAEADEGYDEELEEFEDEGLDNDYSEVY